MSTQYLSFGVVDGRHHPERDQALLRTIELERAGERRDLVAALRRRFLR